MSDAAFYCVADERYFLGAVGLVNSLRLQGHCEPIYLLDCGLGEHQRELMGPRSSRSRPGRPARPDVLKTIAPLAHPAEVMVLIDTDMIVTAASARSDRGRAPREAWWRARRHRSPPAPNGASCSTSDRCGGSPYVSFAILVPGAERRAASPRASSHDRRDAVDFERPYWRAQRITSTTR